MLKLTLTLDLKDEPYTIGELSCQFMQRVQKRAATVAVLLGWLPGIRPQVLAWTWTQKAKYNRLNELYQTGRLN